MITETFITDILTRAPYLLIKIFSIVLLLLHVLFSLVLVRQTKLMVSVIEAKISPLIFSISVVHLFSSLSVLMWSIIFL
jgi:hypothetical protein